VKWHCKVASGYTIDFSVKIRTGANDVHVISGVERGVEFEGYVDLGGQHAYCLAGLSSSASAGTDKGLTLELHFDNCFSYFTGKRVDLEFWKVSGVTRSTADYTEALEACIPKAESSRALQLLERMRKVHVEPDLGSYQAVLRVLEASHQWEDSLSLLQQMKASGIAPDEKCYSSAISSCESGGQGKLALELLDEMAGLSKRLAISVLKEQQSCEAILLLLEQALKT